MGQRLGIEQKMLAVTGFEQVYVADFEHAMRLVDPDVTGAGIEQDQFVIALDARSAIAPGLIANLAQRDAGRTDAALCPLDFRAVISKIGLRHEGSSVARAVVFRQGLL